MSLKWNSVEKYSVPTEHGYYILKYKDNGTWGYLCTSEPELFFELKEGSDINIDGLKEWVRVEPLVEKDCRELTYQEAIEYCGSKVLFNSNVYNIEGITKEGICLMCDFTRHICSVTYGFCLKEKMTTIGGSYLYAENDKEECSTK